jgi:hypothetical protein
MLGRLREADDMKNSVVRTKEYVPVLRPTLGLCLNANPDPTAARTFHAKAFGILKWRSF